MKNLLNRLKSEMSPITAYGLIFLICVLCFLGLDTLAGKVRTNSATLNAAQIELATLNDVKETDFWEQRLDESLRLRKSSNDSLWSGDTSGVIAANAQQTFQSLFLPYQTQQLRIRIEPEIETIENVPTLFFDISGLLVKPQDVADVLAAIAAHPKSIIIVDANLALDPRMERPTRMSISGVLPVRLNASNPAGTNE